MAVNSPLPNEAQPGDRTISRAGVLAAVLVGALAASLVGASTLPGWADALPEGRTALVLGDIARSWQGLVETVGLTRPYAAIRATVRRLEAVKFSSDHDDDAK